MPGEDWKQETLKNFNLYAVTDLTDTGDEVVENIDRAFSGGVDIVQLRSKALSDREMYQLGLKIKPIAAQHRKLFFVNDRLDLALAVGADGLHIGQDDLPVKRVREIAAKAGQSLFLGKSTHSLAQALQTSREDVDYIGVGPVFATPTKPAYQAVGLDLIPDVSKNVRIPFVAIGGINEDNIHQVLQAGATRVAVVRAIFNTGDPYESAKRIKQLFKEHIRCEK